MKNTYYNKLLSKVKKAENVFIAHNAVVIGNVELGNNTSVWYGAVLRADMDKISIGDRTNIQEGCIFHVDPGKPINVGKGNIIGHGAILHGCTIGNNNLIGMRATIMNGATIGNGCIIGAHALVTENTIIPDYSMAIGSPAKIVKQVPPEIVEKIKEGEHEYVNEALKYLAD